MKKNYIAPNVELIVLNTESLIAASIGAGTGGHPTTADTREQGWSSDSWTNVEDED